MIEEKFYDSFTFEKGSLGSLLLCDGWEFPEIWGVKNSKIISEIYLPEISADKKNGLSIKFWCHNKNETLVYINEILVASWPACSSFSEHTLPIQNWAISDYSPSTIIKFQTQEKGSLGIISLWVNGGKFKIKQTPFISHEIATYASLAAPIFITGIPRSGTSILYKIVNNLFEVINPSQIESFFFSWAFSNFKDNFSGDCANAFLGNELSGEFNKYRIENFSAPYLEGIPSLTQYYYRLAGIKYNTSQVIDKTPESLFYWELILKSFPKAKIIFCVRPAIEVFASYKKRLKTPDSMDINGEKKDWLSVEAKDFALIYKEYITAVKSLKKTYENALFVVEYEKLTARDDRHLSGLANFLGFELSSLIKALDTPLNKSNSIDQRIKNALKDGVLLRNEIDPSAYLTQSEICTLRDVESL